MRGSGACRAKDLEAHGRVRPWRTPPARSGPRSGPPERVTGGGPTRTVSGERDGQRAATGLVRSTRGRVTLLAPRARRRRRRHPEGHDNSRGMTPILVSKVRGLQATQEDSVPCQVDPRGASRVGNATSRQLTRSRSGHDQHRRRCSSPIHLQGGAREPDYTQVEPSGVVVADGRRRPDRPSLVGLPARWRWDSFSQPGRWHVPSPSGATCSIRS